MPEFAITMGGYQPPGSVHNRAAGVFADAMAARLGDRFSFTHDPNVTQSGHKATELLSMVEAGELTLCYFSASYLAEQVPDVQVFDLPFVVTDRAQAYAALDGPFGEHLKQQFHENTGFEVLGFWDNGFRHFSNGRRAIRSPADCAGLKIRTMDSALHQDAFRKLGFDPVFVDIKDFQSAVAEGQVDAQENPLTNTFGFGLNKHHRYITLSGHLFGLSLFLCNRAIYHAWPDDIRNAVNDAAAKATAAQRTFAAAEDAEVMSRADLADNEIIELTDIERQAFVEAVAPVIASYRAKLGTDIFSAFA